MLTGVRIEIEGDKLTLAATDRFRLAVRELSWLPVDPADLHRRPGAGPHPRRRGQDARRFTQPRRSPSPSATVCSASSPAAAAPPSGCSTSSSSSTARCCRPATPPPSRSRCRTLTEAIKRVALVTDRGHHLRLQVTDGALTLTAGGDDEGRAEEQLQVDADGAELLIAFNPTYLLDGLSVLRTERVKLAFTTPARPALLLPVVQDDRSDGGAADAGAPSAETPYRYLVMPARLPG